MSTSTENRRRVEFTSRQKAAILIRMFDHETARQVIEHLNPDEKEVLIKEIAIMNDEYFSPDDVEFVMKEYIDYFRSKNISAMAKGLEYVKELFKDLPEKDLERMIGRVYYDVENPFEFLTEIKDLQPLLAFLSGEDAQTIAVVVNYLKPTQSAELLQSLPPEKMIQAVYQLAKLDQIDNELTVRISTLLSKKMDNLSNADQNKIDGIKAVVDVLNNSNRATEKLVFEELEKIDMEVAQEIKNNMFTFEDIATLDDRTIQRVIKEVSDDDTLAKAIKGTNREEIKDQLYRNMSTGKKQIITELIDGMGGIRLKDAEEAQQSIANIVKRLEKDGEIFIQRGEEDVIV